MYFFSVKYEWHAQKNEQLKMKRGISFEQIIFHLGQGNLWKVADHPNQKKYPGQKIYFIVVNDYIYLVPHQKYGNDIFLITIIPSRKATRDYKRRNGKIK